MRLFLHFTVFSFMISMIKAECFWPQCNVGFVSRHNGSTYTPYGGRNTVAREGGCVLVIHKNCDIESRLMTGEYKGEGFGWCDINYKKKISFCTHNSGIFNTTNPHYSMEILDKLIAFSGYGHCKAIRSKFVDFEGGFCLGANLWAYIGIGVGVLAVIIGIPSIIFCSISCYRRKKRENEIAMKERQHRAMLMQMEQDRMDAMIQAENNRMNAMNQPEYKKKKKRRHRKSYDENVGDPMALCFGSPQAPYVDPRMNQPYQYGQPVDPYAPPWNQPEAVKKKKKKKKKKRRHRKRYEENVADPMAAPPMISDEVPVEL